MCERNKEFWNDLKSGKFASMVKESARGQQLANPKEVYNTLKPLFEDQDDVEVFYCLFLNAKNKMISIEKLFSGSITSASIYPREIVKRVLALKATCVVLAHNHPSGDTDPSTEDRNITIKIAIVLDSISVTIHDHIIVGDGFHSMMESGWLNVMQNKISEFATYIKEGA
jgi:DNA repair protein RadC